MDHYREGGDIPTQYMPSTSGVKDLTENPSRQVTVDQLNTINNGLNSYNATTVNTNYAGYNFLKNSGCMPWARPVYGECAESLQGQGTYGNGVSTEGKFTTDFMVVHGENNSNPSPVKPSNFPNCTPGCVWYGISIWKGGVSTNAFLGTAFINYRQVPASEGSAGPGLGNCFFPPREQFIECFVIHGSGSDKPLGTIETFNNQDSATFFSSDANFSYNSANGQMLFGTSKANVLQAFSYNDGLWGYREGATLDGNSVSFINSSVFASFGFGNFKSNDSVASLVYWGRQKLYSGSSFTSFVWTMLN
jgi:hypothetical protein